MSRSLRGRIGYACAYTPLVLIDAAGFVPYRILPTGNWPDQAGQLMHDNLCPHVKRLLDRAMSDDMPDLSGMVFMNSCDAMRRLADAWRQIRPGDRVVLIDLPATVDDVSVAFFARELQRLAGVLADWAEFRITQDRIEASIRRYNRIVRHLHNLNARSSSGVLTGGRARLQHFYNEAATKGFETAETILTTALTEPEAVNPDQAGNVPVYLFGNMLPDPEVFELLASCGALVSGDNFCTGSRLFTTLAAEGAPDHFQRLAMQMLGKQSCARTFKPDKPAQIVEDILTEARLCGAQGIIGYTIKFCDPYLARIPMVRSQLREAGVPFLFLEGDCTLRSMEQQRTRIEAFIEMLR